ncbi:MAG: efflux RND transporter periplasmic adaptor subunit, partial [Candidatus Binatia bacterium]
MRKKGMLALVVAACLGGAAIGWVRNTAEPEAPRFRAVPVERGTIEVTALATGVVQPQNRLELKPPIAGRIERILVREGDRVGRGQILAWMSSLERAALLDAARAKGDAELAHWEELYKAAPLPAPIAGTIIARSVEPGQGVTTTDPVFVLSDRLIVKAQVDETDIGRIRIGEKASVTLDAYSDSKIEARVDHIAFEAVTVNNVTVYEVDVLPVTVPAF